MGRKILIILLILISMLIFTGCGTNNDTQFNQEAQQFQENFKKVEDIL